MTDWGRVIRCTAAAVGAAALLAGCNNGGGSSAGTSQASTRPTIAPDAPTAFDPCQLPQSVTGAEHLDSDHQATDNTASGGVKWHGCIWTAYDGDGYAVDISTTNLTIPMVEANKKFTVAEQLTIDGRQAVTYHQTGTDLRAHCLLHVEMKGGGIEFSLDNPASHKATGTLDSCEIAKKLAGELVPTIPASA